MGATAEPAARGGRTVVRAAAPGDAPAIARVHVASWRETYRGLVPDAVLDGLAVERREELWLGVLGGPDAERQPVAVADDPAAGIVGFAAGGPEREGDPQYSGEIYALYVLAAYHRRGLGRALTAWVVGRLVATGHPGLLIWVLATNPARGFYEALGGQLAGSKPIQIGDATLEEVAYGWPDARMLAVGARRGAG